MARPVWQKRHTDHLSIQQRLAVGTGLRHDPQRQPVPSAPPATGGGGTAGFQDALLLGLGVAALLAGAGSLAYRRRLTRKR